MTDRDGDDVMSDQEEAAPEKEGVIKYGEAKMDTDAFAAGVAKGNINISSQTGLAETIELTEASRLSREKQEELLAKVELRRRLRETVVPTNDAEVRKMLRQIGEPITLFGEREMERRDRLRKLIATSDEAADKLAPSEIIISEEVTARKELFYTEGTEELKEARMKIARWSLVGAAERIAGAVRRREDPDEDPVAECRETAARMKDTINMVSEVADERPLSGCAFCPTDSVLATCSWGGTLKLWSVPQCKQVLSVKAHDARTTGVAWHPNTNLNSGTLALATGCVDATVKLFSGDGMCLQTLKGHTDRLARVAFHPMGSYLGTASFDMTWRLWDLETGSCLLEQEGHSRSIYALAFQCDGSLAASVGLDAVARVWDLRSGRCILTLQGHVKGILSCDFSPNGFLLATGSEDHTARIWDLRQKSCVYTLPGHSGLVTQVRFEPMDGHYVLTSGFDNTCKLWSGLDYSLIKTLAGHEGKVMSSDVAPDGSGLLASVGYDRTLKLWAQEEFF